MQHRFFYYLIAAVLLPCPLRVLAKTSWSFGADLKLEEVWWPKRYGESTDQDLLRLELLPNASAKFSDASRLTIKPELFLDPLNNSPEERVFFDPGDSFFRYRKGAFSLQAGSHLVHWGVTDGYNPLDVVNARQYFDPLHSIKLGAPSLLLTHGTESTELELIYIPQNRRSELPGTQSRWLPRKIFIPRSVDNDTVLLLPEELRYSYEKRQTLNSAQDHNLGVRLLWHWGSIDLGFTAFEGASTFPLIQPIVTGTVLQISPKVIIQTDPDVVLRSKDYRQRVAGFSWVSSQWNFLLKYATNYSQSLGTDPLLPGWTHENIVGLERNFNIGSEGLLVGILQYSFINNEKTNDSNLSVTEIFRRAWMLGGRFSWGDRWTLTALGLYDSQHESHFQQYSLSRRLGDIWTLQASAELFAGRDDTPLGVYTDNDNYRLSLSRSF